MITGDLRSKIDRLWDAFWSEGISNPLEVIEQITYLMFIRRLEDIQTAKERQANRTRKPIKNPIYTEDTQALRWTKFSGLHPDRMIDVVRDGVFPWLRLHENELAVQKLRRKQPFTRLAPGGPETIFDNADVDAIVSVLHHVKATAIPA